MNSNSLFDKMSKATRKAFDNVGRVANVETDPDLMTYQALKPGDFGKMMGEFGEENVLSYIKAMEARRLGVGGNNG